MSFIDNFTTWEKHYKNNYWFLAFKINYIRILLYWHSLWIHDPLVISNIKVGKDYSFNEEVTISEPLINKGTSDEKPYTNGREEAATLTIQKTIKCNEWNYTKE